MTMMMTTTRKKKFVETHENFLNQGKTERNSSTYDTENTLFQDNPVVILTQIRSCAKKKDLLKGIRIHTHILKRAHLLLEKDVYIGSALVGLYAKCGEFSKARNLLDYLPLRNVVSWTSLISGYTQLGMAKEALVCYEEMQCEGISPDASTYVCAMKACGFSGNVEKGGKIHASILCHRLSHKNVIIGTALVDMYTRFGALEKAQEVFDDIPGKDVFIWTVLMSGFTRYGHYEEALRCFEKFQGQGHSLGVSIFVCILKTCGGLGLIEKGKDIHTMIIREGLLQKSMLVSTALVEMYTRCGALTKAQEVFDELPDRDLVLWTTLLDGYALHGYGQKALECYERMRFEGLSPDAFVFVCVLKACGNIESSEDKGRKIHAEIAREGFLEKSTPVGNALIDMYAKYGSLSRAQEVFNELCIRDVVSWNILIAGYAEFGSGEDALSFFECMQRDGLSPNVATFLGVLKACGRITELRKGKQIHSEIERDGLIENNILIGSALVDMYIKCGSFAEAQDVFCDILVRDVFTWNAIISAYVQCGDEELKSECFRRMKCEGVLPDAVTYVCILQACADSVNVRKGREIHVEISQKQLEDDISISNALVYMYAKCGALQNSKDIFDEIPFYDVVSWTALISGYAEVGELYIAIELLNNMLKQGIKPNLVTFTIILNGCRHSGLLEAGQMCFEIMTTYYHMAPTSEHYTCMVDLFGRAGHFDKALVMIQRMPMSDYLPVWTAILGACQKWGNVELAKLAFQHVIWLDPTYEVAYICMNNIYAAAEMHKIEE